MGETCLCNLVWIRSHFSNFWMKEFIEWINDESISNTIHWPKYSQAVNKSVSQRLRSGKILDSSLPSFTKEIPFCRCNQHGTGYFLPWDHGNCTNGFLIALWAGIFEETFADSLYRPREKEAALLISISVTNVFQDKAWTASKDECRLWMKRTSMEKRGSRGHGLFKHTFHSLSTQKRRQRVAVQSMNY